MIQLLGYLEYKFAVNSSFCLQPCLAMSLQSTPLNRVTSGPGYFDPIKRRNLLTENILSQTVIPSYKSCDILTPLSG